MIAPFALRFTYEVNCSECGLVAEAGRWRVHAGTDVPIPSVPDGWSLIDGVLRCNLHRVEICVDGKTIKVST